MNTCRRFFNHSIISLQRFIEFFFGKLFNGSLMVSSGIMFVLVGFASNISPGVIILSEKCLLRILKYVVA